MDGAYLYRWASKYPPHFSRTWRPLRWGAGRKEMGTVWGSQYNRNRSPFFRIKFFDRAHEQYYVRGIITDGEEEERTARGSSRRCLPAAARSGISGCRGLANVTIFSTIAGAAAII